MRQFSGFCLWRLFVAKNQALLTWVLQFVFEQHTFVFLVCKLQCYILELSLPMQHNNHVFRENTICFTTKRLLVSGGETNRYSLPGATFHWSLYTGPVWTRLYYGGLSYFRFFANPTCSCLRVFVFLLFLRQSQICRVFALLPIFTSLLFRTVVLLYFRAPVVHAHGG